VVAHGHVEAGRAFRDLLADVAHAQQAQALAAHGGGVGAELVAPQAAAHAHVHLHDAAHGRQQQAESMVGHAGGVAARGVGHGDAARLGSRDVDKFVAHAQRVHDFQRRQRGDLQRREADGADGQHGADARAVVGDGLGAACVVTGLDHVEAVAELLHVLGLQRAQHEQGGAGSRHGGGSGQRKRRSLVSASVRVGGDGLQNHILQQGARHLLRLGGRAARGAHQRELAGRPRRL
jgi:hypothetical protein